MNEDLKNDPSAKECQAIVPARSESLLDVDPARARTKLAAIQQFQLVVRESLREGIDYGKIPGCGDQPALFKPGAEKISKLLNLYEDYEFIERIEDWDRPLFHYLIRCTLHDMASGTRVASGLGECNSRESRYRYRWVNEGQATEEEKASAVRKKGGRSSRFEPEFAIRAKETTGQFGKPAEYWDSFERAIANHTARAVTKKSRAGKDLVGWEIDVDTTLYQIENPEIYDQVNTMVKIGKKRALVDAALSAGRLSDLFTQDLEDIRENTNALSGSEPELEREPEKKEPAKQAPKASPPKAASKAPAPATPAPSAAAPAKAEEKKPGWPTQEEYEKLKASPLKDIKDEFSEPEQHLPSETEPEAAEPEFPGAEQPKPLSMKLLEQFAKLKSTLATLDVDEITLWKGIHRFSERTFKHTYPELSLFDEKEVQQILSYMERWVKAMELEKKSRLDAQKKKESAS